MQCMPKRGLKVIMQEELLLARVGRFYSREGLVVILSLQHPNQIDLYFVIGLLVIVAVSVFFLMRRK
jgi:hypothetical protein